MNDFGIGFPDAIFGVEKGRMDDEAMKGNNLDNKYRSKLVGLGWWLMMGIGMVVLIGRLVYLQVFEGERNRLLADEQRIRLVQVPAPRGLIVDRNETPLVQNQPIFRRMFVDVEKGVRLEPISRDQALELEVAGYGPSIIEAVGRKYLFGETLVHILGYVGEVSAEELADESMGYELGDLVGRAGVEAADDGWLRGDNGARLVEVDTAGRLVRQVGSRPPVSGRKLQLAIDLDLQRIAWEALKGKKGAVVASDANSGELLAMVSYPSYDPEILNPGNAEIYKDEIVKLFSDDDRPLVNRSIAAVYAPGSTFKIVTAAAALEEELINEEYRYEDIGVVKLGDYEYKNWYLTQYGGKEGLIGITRAIARSTDTFFYKTGELVGADKLAEWGRKFGLGSLSGVGLDEELPGLVPDPAWKMKTIGERWFLGNTYHMAIGQADLLTTPLQVNVMTGVIANGGSLCQPVLVRNELEIDSQFKVLSEGEATGLQGCQNLGLNEETLRIIKEGMVGACSAGGTAVPLFDFEPQVACKTGTAEYGPVDEFGYRKTHAWLTTFAPVENPEVVVTVLLEGGGEGSRDAAPIAKEVLEGWKKLASNGD